MSGHCSPMFLSNRLCLNRLYRGDPGITPSIPEETLKRLLQLCVYENTFVFGGNVYQQLDGVAMGSSLGPLLANIYMAHLEEEYILKTQHHFSPSFYRRYVDDTFCIFRTKDHVDPFLNFIVLMILLSLIKNLKLMIGYRS